MLAACLVARTAPQDVGRADPDLARLAVVRPGAVQPIVPYPRSGGQRRSGLSLQTPPECPERSGCQSPEVEHGGGSRDDQGHEGDEPEPHLERFGIVFDRAMPLNSANTSVA